MAALKRPKHVKLKLSDRAEARSLTFSERLGGHHSIYRDMLVSALDGEKDIVITAGDKYALIQFKKFAKELKVRLLFAVDAEDLRIRPARIEGELQRLLLLLREPRSLAELQAKKLELDLKKVLSDQTSKGFIAAKNGAYRLTEEGLRLLV